MADDRQLADIWRTQYTGPLFRKYAGLEQVPEASIGYLARQSRLAVDFCQKMMMPLGLKQYAVNTPISLPSGETGVMRTHVIAGFGGTPIVTTRVELRRVVDEKKKKKEESYPLFYFLDRDTDKQYRIETTGKDSWSLQEFACELPHVAALGEYYFGDGIRFWCGTGEDDLVIWHPETKSFYGAEGEFLIEYGGDISGYGLVKKGSRVIWCQNTSFFVLNTADPEEAEVEIPMEYTGEYPRYTDTYQWNISGTKAIGFEGSTVYRVDLSVDEEGLVTISNFTQETIEETWTYLETTETTVCCETGLWGGTPYTWTCVRNENGIVSGCDKTLVPWWVEFTQVGDSVSTTVSAMGAGFYGDQEVIATLTENEASEATNHWYRDSDNPEGFEWTETRDTTGTFVATSSYDINGAVYESIRTNPTETHQVYRWVTNKNWYFAEVCEGTDNQVSTKLPKDDIYWEKDCIIPLGVLLGGDVTQVNNYNFTVIPFGYYVDYDGTKVPKTTCSTIPSENEPAAGSYQIFVNGAPFNTNVAVGENGYLANIEQAAYNSDQAAVLVVSLNEERHVYGLFDGEITELTDLVVSVIGDSFKTSYLPSLIDLAPLRATNRG